MRAGSAVQYRSSPRHHERHDDVGEKNADDFSDTLTDCGLVFCSRGDESLPQLLVMVSDTMTTLVMPTPAWAGPQLRRNLRSCRRHAHASMGGTLLTQAMAKVNLRPSHARMGGTCCGIFSTTDSAVRPTPAWAGLRRRTFDRHRMSRSVPRPHGRDTGKRRASRPSRPPGGADVFEPVTLLEAVNGRSPAPEVTL